MILESNKCHSVLAYLLYFKTLISAFGSGTDLVSVLILFFFMFGDTLQRSVRLHHFKSDRDEIWQDCSSTKMRIDWRSPIFDMMPYVQDGGHDVISHKKIVAIWWVHTQQHLPGAYTAASASSWSTVLPSFVCHLSAICIWYWSIVFKMPVHKL